MEVIFFIAALIALLIFFSNMKTAHNNEVLEHCSPIINSWVNSKNGKVETIRSTQYKDDSLSVFPGSRIFVGRFDRHEGEPCGFYLEVLGGEVVVEMTYFPEGITSWHKQLSHQAKISGQNLFYLLNKSEEAHHEKYPHWRDVR